MIGIVKISSYIVFLNYFWVLQSFRLFIHYFYYFLFWRKLYRQLFGLVFVEAFYKRSEINGWLKSCHDYSCHNIYNSHETSSVWKSAKKSCYCAYCQFMGVIHLYINTNESISVAFVRWEILNNWVINPGFYIVILLFRAKYHAIIMSYVIFTYLHVIIHTSVVLRG